MPPKSKKQEQKVKQKIVEDKTFGLKNKNKSAKVNKYVQQVQKQYQVGPQKAEEDIRKKKEAKEEAEKKKKELAALFKPVLTQKVAVGVDPKSVVCAFFKQGLCTKGDKCKFSHDLSKERKSAKIDLYTDARDSAKEQDTMDKWDQDKLESVVKDKHGPGIKTTTDIVCKYFLEAIEQKKYGWFWECPNGGQKCKYRHALPPGFVLKSEKQKEEEKEQITLEEFLETERHKLGDNLTPVTLESFTAWKASRIAKLAEEADAKTKDRAQKVKSGKLMASGKELFTFNPELFKDDEDATEIDYTTREEITQDENPGPINEELFNIDDLDSLNIDDE
ncbi:hypothetical protein O9G_003632 [Rozella allomycis CSF55]|uniref:C3H1-type domain-containing protein n=1 Tax=Rozella allomycis (strain CSF55) TaxID=988480 RepID=A0A075B2Z0_ROZAC|nr:hypothetical protein O9G_003632 [Rozella allomycis CSF55]|eukprot:EPZ35143.1 hypothetical protein O9G_003632 [Rozella allomycis CSF55]